MTKEEAREAIKEAYGNSEYTDEIINALEQEPILDKIKEVIAKWKADNFTDGYAWDCMKEITDIVDKAESEEK